MLAKKFKNYIKLCDVTFIPVKTFVPKKSQEGKQNTWHKSVAGGILSILFMFMIFSYIIYLLYQMVFDKQSIVVVKTISNHYQQNPNDKAKNVSKYFFTSIEINTNKESFNHEIFKRKNNELEYDLDKL